MKSVRPKTRSGRMPAGSKLKVRPGLKHGPDISCQISHQILYYFINIHDINSRTILINYVYHISNLDCINSDYHISS